MFFPFIVVFLALFSRQSLCTAGCVSMSRYPCCSLRPCFRSSLSCKIKILYRPMVLQVIWLIMQYSYIYFTISQSHKLFIYQTQDWLNLKLDGTLSIKDKWSCSLSGLSCCTATYIFMNIQSQSHKLFIRQTRKW